MKISCNRVEYTLDNTDLIMFNGNCYQIVTKKVTQRGFCGGYPPIIAKSKAKKLIKDNILIEVNKNEKDGLTYYQIKGDK